MQAVIVSGHMPSIVFQRDKTILKQVFWAQILLIFQVAYIMLNDSEICGLEKKT